jgi:hypothetical protein
MSSLTRRAMLRRIAAGAGGALLLPLMSRLVKSAPPYAPRFVFIVEGNCYEPITVLDPATLAAINMTAKQQVTADDRWWFSKVGHSTPLITPSTQFANTKALGAIATNGLSGDTAVLLGLSSRITGGGHSAFHGVLSSTRTVGGQPNGPTIDAALATVPLVRGQAPYDAVRLGVSYDLKRRLNYDTCAYDRRRAAPLIVDPYAAFTTLFGLVGSAAEQAAFDQRGHLLDFALADTNAALGTFSGNSDERAKVEAYLSALQTGSQRQTQLLSMRNALTPIAPESPTTNPLYSENLTLKNNPIKRFAGQLELATAALIGELTHVAVIGCGSGGNFDMQYPSSPIPGTTGVTRHNLHHGSATDANYLNTIHDITRQQIDAIVQYMALPLKNTPDPNGGTMLDNTIIVYIGDNGEQHHSTGSEFPVVLIGGSALGLKTGGRTIVYPGVDTGGTGHRQVSNLWATLGKLAGATPIQVGTTKVDFDLFGAEGPGRIAPGPLTELIA